MQNRKTENRFIKFFERNRKIFLPFKYFINIVGIVVIILFILELVSQALLKEDSLEAVSEYLGDPFYYYEPYLDFGYPYHETKNPCKDMSEDPLLIYTFGGSTMWGAYAEEDETIASYISELICKEEIPVEVKNFGVAGYVNTQEIIKLFFELGDDEVPDIVVFYDGANDIGLPTPGYNIKIPQAFEYFAQKMNYRKSIFSNLKEYLGRRFGDTDLSLNLEDDILDGYFSKFHLKTDGLYGEELYEKVMEIYLNNVKIVKSMEEDWGFKSFFYWQPNLYDKIGSLTDEEEVFLGKYSAGLEQFKTADPIVNESLNDAKYVRDLREVFSNRSDTVFTDWCHILPENNRIIAEKMVEDIMKYLKESNYYEKK